MHFPLEDDFIKTAVDCIDYHDLQKDILLSGQARGKHAACVIHVDFLCFHVACPYAMNVLSILRKLSKRIN